MPSDFLLTVESNDDLGAAHHLLTLVCPPGTPAIPSWQAGQFAMIGLGLPAEATDPLLRRPFSLFNLPDGGPGGSRRARFFYKILGRGTAMLSRAAPGETIRCLAPLGNGFRPPQRPGGRLLLVAGGIGSASLHPLALQEMRDGRSPLMLYGCRTASDLAGVGPSREAGVEVLVATDDGTAGRRGFASDLLDSFLRDEGPSAGGRWTVCACGPTAMMKATSQVAARHGAPCYLSLESPMACGFGVCVGCVVGVHGDAATPVRYRRICVDGPVFDASSVIW
jgi:dihydroorotate dehydrogenase electron transfer subunit